MPTVIGPKSLCDSCPTLEMSSSGGESEDGEMVFDLDKDGIHGSSILMMMIWARGMEWIWVLAIHGWRSNQTK